MKLSKSGLCNKNRWITYGQPRFNTVANCVNLQQPWIQVREVPRVIICPSFSSVNFRVQTITWEENNHSICGLYGLTEIFGVNVLKWIKIIIRYCTATYQKVSYAYEYQRHVWHWNRYFGIFYVFVLHAENAFQ
jgi:hypothetical protein